MRIVLHRVWEQAGVGRPRRHNPVCKEASAVLSTTNVVQGLQCAERERERESAERISEQLDNCQIGNVALARDGTGPSTLSCLRLGVAVGARCWCLLLCPQSSDVNINIVSGQELHKLTSTNGATPRCRHRHKHLLHALVAVRNWLSTFLMAECRDVQQGCLLMLKRSSAQRETLQGGCHCICLQKLTDQQMHLSFSACNKYRQQAGARGLLDS